MNILKNIKICFITICITIALLVLNLLGIINSVYAAELNTSSKIEEFDIV